MWKDFFYYSKSERRVILVLLAVAVLALGFYIGTRCWQDTSNSPLVSENEDADSFRIRIREREEARSFKRKFKKQEVYNTQEIVLTDFNPNTADSATLRSLGLSAFVVRNILRYREKGGVFRTPEALAKIYGLSSEQYLSLRPYIVIPASSVSSSAADTLYKPISQEKVAVSSKYPQGTVLDLNAADTAELKRIPGIGNVLARRIVSYRQRLGGFYRVNQLQEIEHVDTVVNKWFRVDGNSLRLLKVNHAGLDELRSHPYMNFYKAKAILEYRRKRGKIKGLSRLSLFEEFSEKDLERLSPYLSFD